MTDDQHDAHHGGHHDDDLRALLRSADPAPSLPQADPTRVARLLEDTMTDQLTDESRADGTHDRSPLTWLIAAAAAALILGGVFFAVGGRGGDDPTPTAGDRPAAGSGQEPGGDAGPDGQDDQGDPNGQAGEGDPGDPGAPPERTVTELTVAGAEASGKCMAPEAAPDVIANQDTVFDGTVESISGRTVTLVPTRFYNGEETDVVVVQAPGQEMEALLSAVTFEEGGRYLVAATDGRVTLCGFSAEYSDSLAAVYGQAF